MSYLDLCSNTLGKVVQELVVVVQSLGSLSLIKGYAEANLTVVFCEELGITSLFVCSYPAGMRKVVYSFPTGV